MAKHKKFLDIFATAGIILGFGAFGVDFLFGKKLEKSKRIMLFVGTTSVLSGFIIAVDSFLGNSLSQNILIGTSFPLLVLSFGLMGLSGFALFSLFLQAADIITKYLIGVRGCPGVAPLIPGVELPGVPITPPLHAWISLLIILVVHEGMHGIVGRRFGFEIKSTGLLLLGFLPIGAFVEPDEKQVEKAKAEKVVPFLAAGPTANMALMFITGIIVFGSIFALPIVTESLYPGLQDNLISGVRVSKVLEETGFCGSTFPSSAYGNFEKEDIILAVNNTPIKNSTELFSELQTNRFDDKTFLLQRGEEQIEMTLSPNELGQFGFVPEQIRNENYEAPESFIYYIFVAAFSIEFIYWLFLLNFLVAIINFLPMHPFDGGRIAKKVFSPYLTFISKNEKEREELVGKIFTYIILLLFVINALPLFI